LTANFWNHLLTKPKGGMQSLPSQAHHPKIVKRQDEWDRSLMCNVHQVGRKAGEMVCVDDIRGPLLQESFKNLVDFGIPVDTFEPIHIPEVIIEPKDLEVINAVLEDGVFGLIRPVCPCKDSYVVSRAQLLSEFVNIVLRSSPALRWKHMNDITNSHQFDSSASFMEVDHIIPVP
jgi:hypothetical protein